MRSPAKAICKFTSHFKSLIWKSFLKLFHCSAEEDVAYEGEDWLGTIYEISDDDHLDPVTCIIDVFKDGVLWGWLRHGCTPSVVSGLVEGVSRATNVCKWMSVCTCYKCYTCLRNFIRNENQSMEVQVWSWIRFISTSMHGPQFLIP